MTDLETRMEDQDILVGLDGKTLSFDRLSAALRESGDVTSQKIVAVDVVPGSVLRWPQSHSAKLNVSLGSEDVSTGVRSDEQRKMYLKKVIAQGLPSTKSLSALRRDLASNRNEARFYSEFASILAARGVPLLSCVVLEQRLDNALGDHVDEGPFSPVAGEGNSCGNEEARLRSGGMVLVMESAEGYEQTSPLSLEQTRQSLQLLAKMHGAAWEDQELLLLASRRLHPVGGYWTLDKRGEEEMGRMRENWRQYISNFARFAPELFAREDIVNMAARVEAIVPLVSRQMAAGPDDRFATLIHGDYKAMNIFLKVDFGALDSHDVVANDETRIVLPRSEPSLPIDFQWTGVGFGMSDVAMHLSHSVATSALQMPEGCEAAERALVEVYRKALLREVGDSRGVAYRPDIAWRHYCLGVVDYARMLIGCFLTNASPEAFAARADKQNVGLAYRNVEASLLFVERTDRCLRLLEQTMSTS
eukprot:TRINITY_DN44015_c0_g1_i1.p1 TRINITY_DN44015_c0_g1~~TRINITY_DN44015_c0_g1_i1.p1  ORF type:complete len:475 (-),score=60.29 TRINITY_DN44015_c0_g1_i1:206-1630(-)